jgi:hypothetical protein
LGHSLSKAFWATAIGMWYVDAAPLKCVFFNCLSLKTENTKTHIRYQIPARNQQPTNHSALGHTNNQQPARNQESQ